MAVELNIGGVIGLAVGALINLYVGYRAGKSDERKRWHDAAMKVSEQARVGQGWTQSERYGASRALILLGKIINGKESR